MAHLWYEEHSGEWRLALLREGAVTLGTTPGEIVEGSNRRPASALLLRSRIATSEQWYVMNVSLQPLSVNGESLRTGIRALHDRDEIRGRGIGRLFFATESLPTIEAFAGSDREMLCTRCRTAIVAGAPTIRCGICNAVFHEDAAADLLCFSYGATCPLCGGPTVLTDTYRFQPADL